MAKLLNPNRAQSASHFQRDTEMNTIPIRPFVALKLATLAALALLLLLLNGGSANDE